MHDSPSTVFGPARIRPLTADDLLIVRRLLSERDGRDWDAESTRWFVEGLDPERCRAWAAFDGEKPVGLTTAFLRKLTIDGQQQRVAYWANLYVDPEVPRPNALPAAACDDAQCAERACGAFFVRHRADSAGSKGPYGPGLCPDWKNASPGPATASRPVLS